MTDFAQIDFASAEPADFAHLVKSTPDKQIAEVMAGDLRDKILAEVFSRMPKHFRADRAGNLDTVVHWHITGRSDGGVDTYQVVIADGACTVSDSADQEPKLSVTLGPVEFLKIVSSNANPVTMFMTGKLKAKGDLALAANITNLFELPKV